MDNREPELPILLYSVMGGDFQRQTPNPLDSLIWALPASEGRLGSKLMVTKVLPEGPVAPLEEAPLKGLIQRALRAGLRDLNGTDVSGDDWLVFRPTSEGYSSTRLPAPMYVRETVWNRIQEIWKSQESDELTEYLWSRGAFKKTLTRDDELPPSREAWERVVWGELVHGPLLVLLNRAASEELTLTGAYVPWNIDDAAIELAAADLARQSCRREFTFTAICPIIGLNLSDRAFLAESGVNLSSWSNDDRAIFLTRYHQEYLADDMAPWFSNAKITIDATCSISDETAENLVVSALDRLKWAITLGADSEGQYEEGAVILRGIGGWRGRAIRRSDTLLRSRTLPTIEIDSEVAQTVQRFLVLLNSARAKTSELDAGLWLFGRSCTAPLARDSVLDAVIGLEMLLIAGPGESRYKFGLHGTAVIDDPSGDVENILKHLYDLRSKAAHGVNAQAAEFIKVAPRARKLLAKCIFSIANLIDLKELDVEKTNGDIGSAVTAMVKKRVLGTS